jgi:hypothetical protein
VFAFTAIFFLLLRYRYRPSSALRESAESASKKKGLPGKPNAITPPAELLS